MPDPDEIVLRTDRGQPVLAAYRQGEGWWVSWNAAVRPRYASAVRSAVAALVASHFPGSRPQRPTAIVDPLRRRLTPDSDLEEVAALVTETSAALELVDHESSKRWYGSSDQHGLARFEIDASGDILSLAIERRESRMGSAVVSLPSRQPLLTPEVSEPEPPDFDAVWEHQLEKLASVPIDFELTDFPQITCDEFTGYRLRFRGWDGRPSTGVVTIPAADPHGAAGILTTPGYSVAGIMSHLWELADRAAILSVDVCRVGSASTLPRPYPGPLCVGLLGEAELGMTSAVMEAACAYRVLQALCPGGELAATGASQGGTLSLAIGYLFPGTRVVAAGVPFLVNVRNKFRTRTKGTFLELQEFLARHPEAEDDALRKLSYVDARLFLARVRQPCLLTLSPDDDVAPGMELESVAKDMPNVTLVVQPGGHMAPALPHLRATTAAFLREQLNLNAAH